jgi:tetratricopeptide (TPR) repeat protein
MEHFKRAIELDPSYGNAYVGLSDAYRIFWWYSPNLDPIPVRDSARVLLEKALDLDSQNPEALASLASFRLHWEWDLPGAQTAIERALFLSPDNYRVSSWHANILPYIGGVEPALAQQRRVLSMDPFNAGVVADLGLYLRNLGRLDQAIAQYEASLEINPANPIVRTGLGWVYLESGRIDEALIEFEGVGLDDLEAAGGLTTAYVQLGQRDEALRVYQELLALANQQPVSKLALARALKPLDETGAFDLLAQATEGEDPHLLESMRWGWWSYREHPRYREILNSMGLDIEDDRFVEYRGGD